MCSDNQVMLKGSFTNLVTAMVSNKQHGSLLWSVVSPPQAYKHSLLSSNHFFQNLEISEFPHTFSPFQSHKRRTPGDLESLPSHASKCLLQAKGSAGTFMPSQLSSFGIQPTSICPPVPAAVGMWKQAKQAMSVLWCFYVLVGGSCGENNQARGRG